MGKSITIKKSDADTAIIALGSPLTEALKAADLLQQQGINVDVINARFAKPIDEQITSLFYDKKHIITLEDHSLACGFGSAVLELAAKKNLENSGRTGTGNIAKIINIAGPDEFVKAAPRTDQLDEIGINADRIAQTVKKVIGD